MDAAICFAIYLISQAARQIIVPFFGAEFTQKGSSQMNSPTYISDRPSLTDALGRSHFAKALSKALLSVSSGDGLVVAIEGTWGSGKSTIIGFVKNHLADSGEYDELPIVVDFNPWMVSNTGAIVDALVTQIAAAIQLGPNTAEKGVKAGQKLLDYVGLIGHLKHLKYLKYVPGASWAANIAEDVAQVAESVGEGSKTAQDAFDEVKKLLPALDLTRRKAEVVEALRELDRPIVVFVDDVDRLPAEEIRTIVQAIKAVADFPRTTYLLAYDREVVAAALGSGNEAVGLSYLEKIVQVAYPIPPLFQYQITAFATDQIERLLRCLGINLKPYEAENFHQAMGLVTKLSRQPRDVVRLANRLMLSLPATHGEVNAVDVIVFEALSQRFPAIRESVHRHPADFVGSSFRGDTGDVIEDYWQTFLDSKDQKNESPLWEKHMPQNGAGAAKKACSFLFPEKEKGDAEPEDRLRLADPDRLARFFRMASLESVPEAREMHDCLADSAKLAASIEGLENAELALRLEWLYNYVPSCVGLNPFGCIQTLARAANRLAASKALTTDLVALMGKLLERLLRAADNDVRSTLLIEIANAAPISVAELSVFKAAAEQGKWFIRPSMQKSSEAQLVQDGEAVDAAVDAWSSRIRAQAETGILASDPELHSVLYRFGQLNRSYAETYRIVGEICKTEQGLEIFLSHFHNAGDLRGPEHFGLVEDATALVDRIEKSTLKEKFAWISTKIGLGSFTDAINEHSARMKSLDRG